MATTYTYQTILERVQANGALNPMNSSAGGVGGGSMQFQIQQLQPIDFPMKDLDYESTFVTTQQDITKVLSITQDSIGFTNTYVNSPQILINSDRVIINTKKDYLMLFGGAGVAVSSQNPVNIDSDSSTTIAATEGIFLGVPNKGVAEWPKIAKPKTKGDPTPDQPYEPMTLGIKLANLLEDLLVILKNARIATPAGLAYFREDAQYDLANLQARLPEMLSTAVFIDGISHESTDPAPSPPATITNPVGIIIGSGGSFGGGGFGGGALPKQAITAADKDYATVVATVIDKLEGGYWSDAWFADPALAKKAGWPYDKRYGSSGETMFGIDRRAGGSINTTTAGKQFWALIDGANAKNTWKWGYRGGSLEAQLRDLAGQIIRPTYDTNAKNYLSAQSRQIVESDGRLYFNFVYACWNGPGWFKKFAQTFNEAVARGITNPDQLCKVVIDRRINVGYKAGSPPNSLVKQGGYKIAGLIGVPV